MFSRNFACIVFACALLAAGASAGVQAAPVQSPLCPAWTVDDLLASPTPFAVGHRGYGQNLTDFSRPIENSLDAFRHGFTDGLRVVELDLQRTADGKIVVFHDDFLADYTCVSSLTYDQLLLREPQAPLFRTMLNAMRHFDLSNALSGMVLAEIKVPVPLCDGANTTALADASEAPLVAAVLEEIRAAHMEHQVILNSESPSILAQVRSQAPEMPTALTLNFLQLLPPEVAEPIVGQPITLIAKNNLGLKWYEIDSAARLPGYDVNGDQQVAFANFVGTTLGIQSGAVSLDMMVLQYSPDPGAVVAALHAAGLKVVAWTANSIEDWQFLASAGVDGITTNDIADALANQPPLTDAFLCVSGGGLGPTAGAVASPGPAATARLALAPTRAHPFTDGQVHVSFALDNAAPARLALYDVAGRSVEAREVGALGAGRHELAMGDGLAPGVYFVRLSAGAQRELLKAVVSN